MEINCIMIPNKFDIKSFGLAEVVEVDGVEGICSPLLG